MAKLNPESRFKFIVLTILCFIVISMFMYRYDSATRSVANTVRILENAEAIKFVIKNLDMIKANQALILAKDIEILKNQALILTQDTKILKNQAVPATLEKTKNANIR